MLPYNAVHSIQQTEQIPNDPPRMGAKNNHPSTPLMQVFEQTTDESLNNEARYILLRLAEDTSEKKLSEAVTNTNLIQLLFTTFTQFEKRFHHGELGKTAQFCLCYMDKYGLFFNFKEQLNRTTSIYT